MKKVLIIGATGNIGQHTIKEALKAGHQVTAFGRSIEKITTEHQQLTIVKGDATNKEDLDQAMQDQEAVILTFGAPLTMDTILHQPDLMEEGTKKVIASMQEAGVKRLIGMTAIGAGDSVGHGRFIFRNIIEPVLLGRIMKDRTAQEEVIKAAGLEEWTIVRPTELTDGETANIRVIENLSQEKEPSTIARKDVGYFLAKLIDNKGYDFKAVTITND